MSDDAKVPLPPMPGVYWPGADGSPLRLYSDDQMRAYARRHAGAVERAARAAEREACRQALRAYAAEWPVRDFDIADRVIGARAEGGA